MWICVQVLRFADFCAVIYTCMVLIGLGVTAAWLSSWSGSMAVDHSQGIIYETRSPRELMFESRVYEHGVPCRLQNLSSIMPFIAHPSVALDLTTDHRGQDHQERCFAVLLDA